MKKYTKVALLGNPNAGKTSLFNNLTGLNQKVGNYPGVTVDKKIGKCKLPNGSIAEIVDLPGTYSINPKSLDEHVAFNSIFSSKEKEPDIYVVIVDETNLKRNLLLFTQVKDLGKPVILALNMVELAQNSGIYVDCQKLKTELGIPVLEINARKGDGLDSLMNEIQSIRAQTFISVFKPKIYVGELIHEIKKLLSYTNDFRAYQIAIQSKTLSFLTQDQKNKISAICEKHKLDIKAIQSLETIDRYRYIDNLIEKCVFDSEDIKVGFSEKLDKILTHKVWGYVIFTVLMFFIFQVIFSASSYPMGVIDDTFMSLANWIESTLPNGVLVNLLVQGIIPGLSGVFIFIPQITILFIIVAVLEESGYMSRVMFIMDRFMYKFGMNGKSVVPLISGIACAVPAIMATRVIGNWKERMITIFVTPLMSCSARLPVYIILISVVIPDKHLWGIFNFQGLLLMALYVFGFVVTLISAYLMKKFLNKKERSFFILEMPAFRYPRWKNIGIEVYNKVKIFVWNAGKVILLISIILWFLATHGGVEKFTQLEQKVLTENKIVDVYSLPPTQQHFLDAKKLEYSYAGQLGKFIEPSIKPLGYDWKIGIALICSFAAREVFVGTMSTIYSIDPEMSEIHLADKLKNTINPDTGLPVFTLATAVSLLIFYALAMQCMSTIAIVYRETKSWKWPLAQFLYMSGMAYLFSILAFLSLS